ncbi:MAG TPA: DUF2793 domain-containing protein [Allosphingosinicella sp.]|nr:DUF2793 domain-containing protein [Allosphingosinicella sp.]
MTDVASPRFALPFILPGQAQKELFHNEALIAVDALLHAAVESGPVTVPPSTPVAGQSWVVAGGAGGAWAGHEQSLASWTSGGWRFTAPGAGMIVWNKAGGHWLQWTGSGWSSGELPATKILVDGQQVVGARQPAVPNPSGGTIIDAEARAAVEAVIVALKAHGLID